MVGNQETHTHTKEASERELRTNERKFNDVLYVHRVCDDGYKVAMIKSMKNRRHIENWPMQEKKRAKMGAEKETTANGNIGFVTKKLRLSNAIISYLNRKSIAVGLWVACQPLTMTEWVNISRGKALVSHHLYHLQKKCSPEGSQPKCTACEASQHLMR